MADEKPRNARSKLPTAVDLHVAARIRERRIKLEMSQNALAEKIGVSFQQVQKYENGRNRIAGSRLQAIVGALQVPMSYLYEGLPQALAEPGGFGEAPSPPYLAESDVSSDEGREMVAAFLRIGDREVRDHILALVRALADSPPPKRRGRPSY